MTMIKIYMEHCRFVERWEGIKTGPIASFETSRKGLMGSVEFVSDIEECDLIHVHDVVSPSAIACLVGKKPYVIHAHLLPGDLGEKTFAASIMNKLEWMYLFRLYKNSKKVIAVSKHGKEELVRLGIDDKNICVIGNSVDLEKFKFNMKKRVKMREELGIKKTDTVVYSVGNVQRRKGVDDFIKLAEMNPHLKFVWFGGFLPSFYTGCSKRVIEEKIKKIKNIKFTGFVDDIVAAHCCGDIFCFPSLYEGQGIVVLEAAACGRPLLLRNIRAYEEFENGKSCLKANSYDEFNYNLNRLINDKKLKQKISKNANKQVKKYDIKDIAKKVLDVYEEVV